MRRHLHKCPAIWVQSFERRTLSIQRDSHCCFSLNLTQYATRYATSDQWGESVCVNTDRVPSATRTRKLILLMGEMRRVRLLFGFFGFALGFSFAFFGFFAFFYLFVNEVFLDDPRRLYPGDSLFRVAG